MAKFVFLDCYTERLPGESANDRNDRAIRVACKWYEKHLKRNNIAVVLLSNDAENRRIAKEEMSLTCETVRNYIETFKESSELVDKLSSHSTDDTTEKTFGKELYSLHRTPVEINSGIKAGKLLQGVFFLSRTNFKEGTVNCEANDQPILIQGIYFPHNAAHILQKEPVLRVSFEPGCFVF